MTLGAVQQRTPAAWRAQLPERYKRTATRRVARGKEQAASGKTREKRHAIELQSRTFGHRARSKIDAAR